MFHWQGHLGTSVSALVDGQLDEESAERAWAHVMRCAGCRRLVAREGWAKTQLAQLSGQPAVDPPAHLLGSLYMLDATDEDAARDTREAWAAVERIEERGRGRRRAGIALVGAGSVSAAVLGFSTMTGATLGIGNAPSGPPTTSLNRSTPSVQPVAPSPSGRARPSTGASVWQSPFPSWVSEPTGSGTAVPVSVPVAP
jgi:hypothetical protein